MLFLLACTTVTFSVDGQVETGPPSPGDSADPSAGGPVHASVTNAHPFGDELFTQVSVGDDHACALRADGTIRCVGEDIEGETHPPAGSFVSVHAGRTVDCARKFDGTITCWGNPDHVLMQQVPSESFIDLRMGRNDACGLSGTGHAFCWPDELLPPEEVFAQIEVGVGLRPDQSVYFYASSVGAGDELPAGTYLDIAVGYGFTCGVRTDGSLACTQASEPWEFEVPEGRDYVKVDARGYHGCAQHQDGTLSCWMGWNYVWDQPTTTFTSFSVGSHAGCGLEASGVVTCWRNDLAWE